MPTYMYVKEGSPATYYSCLWGCGKPIKVGQHAVSLKGGGGVRYAHTKCIAKVQTLPDLDETAAVGCLQDSLTVLDC